MTPIILVAKNAFRAVMSQRALYMWGFAIVIMFLRSGPALFASPERGPEFVAFLRANAVSGSLDIWSYLCMAGAIYLGATSIASELRAKTIITVLSHPIRRWQLMIGKWIGLSAFCTVTPNSILSPPQPSPPLPLPPQPPPPPPRWVSNSLRAVVAGRSL